jgi:hypothetical protein
VAQVRISPDRQSFQVRPLGLYFQRPLAKTGGSISIAVEIIGNGVWVDKTRGEKAQIFDETILKGEKYTDQQLVSQPIRYFKKLPIDIILTPTDPFIDWSNYEIIPLPPASVASNGTILLSNSKETGELQLTAKAAEVGAVPGWLNTLAGILKSEGGAAAKALSSAVDTEAGLTGSSSASSAGG